MKQLYALLIFFCAASALPAQTVVFDSDLGGYFAFDEAGGLLGTEDYITDVSSFGIPANTATLSEMTFVGGITGSSDGTGGVLDILFYDAAGNFANSAAFILGEGAFIYTLTLADLDVPSAGFIQLFIDDTRVENAGRAVVGQWFFNADPAGPIVGQSPQDPFTLGPDANGDDFNFAFSLTANTVFLPVEFTAVNVAPVKTGLEVTWATASEEDNRGFEVERSEDGVSFASVGFVTAQGRSGNGGNYSFTDETILKNTDYLYRIRQVDFDGTSMLSEVVSGAWNDEVFTVGNIFPNPAITSAALTLHLEKAQSTTLRVFDASGRQVSTNTYGLDAGNHRLSVNTAEFAAGLYLVEVVSAEKRVTQRLTVR